MPWETMVMKHRTSFCKCTYCFSSRGAAWLPRTSLQASWQSPAAPVTLLLPVPRHETVRWELSEISLPSLVYHFMLLSKDRS